MSSDMRAAIIPKSDQMNADDLIGGERTIKIKDVQIRPGTEQPVSVLFDGDNGKPWKPCKSMARVLVYFWGADAKAYVGRRVTLYLDPDVRWGGVAVGGIRISHLSDISQTLTISLTVTKGKRSPFTVKPLSAETDPMLSLQSDAADAADAGMAAYQAFFTACDADQRKALMPSHEARKEIAAQADAKAAPSIDNSAALAAIESAATLPDLMAMWHGLPQSVTDDEAVYEAYAAKRDGFASQKTGE